MVLLMIAWKCAHSSDASSFLRRYSHVAIYADLFGSRHSNVTQCGGNIVFSQRTAADHVHNRVDTLNAKRRSVLFLASARGTSTDS